MRKCYRCKMTADGPKAGQRGAAGDGPITSNCSHLSCFLNRISNNFSLSLYPKLTPTKYYNLVPIPRANC